MKYILHTLLTLAVLCGLAQAQRLNSIPCYPHPPCKAAQVKPYSEEYDRLKVSAAYLNTEFQANPFTSLQYLKGFSVDADYKIYGYEGFRLGAVANFQKVFDQPVILGYVDEDGSVVSIYRNVSTYSFGAQLSKRLGPAEPFAAFFLGFRRPHEDLKRVVTRKYRLGLDIPFHKESHFFIRPFFVEFEAVEGSPNLTNGIYPSGTTQKYGVGAGFRF